MSNIITRQTTAASNVSGTVTNKNSVLTSTELDGVLITLNNEKLESTVAYNAATDNTLVAFNGTNGKMLKAATVKTINGATITGSGDISAATPSESIGYALVFGS